MAISLFRFTKERIIVTHQICGKKKLHNFTNLLPVKMQRIIGREISERIKDGDEKAFELVFRTLYPSLFRFCNDYLFEPEVSKNIVQSVYMKLWERRRFLNTESSLKGFLFTMARNECLSYLRHLKAEARYFKNVVCRFEDQMLGLDALNELDFQKNDIEILENAIDATISTLPERCREVFILSRNSGLKNREIAEKLNISIKAVEANLSRAIKALKQNLRDYLTILMPFL
jgi:RNA polymerase sigma-70 factor (ECF subfamily)